MAVTASRAVAVIGAALDRAAGRRGVDMGPSAIRYAGLAERIERLGRRCDDWGNVAAARGAAASWLIASDYKRAPGGAPCCSCRFAAIAARTTWRSDAAHAAVAARAALGERPPSPFMRASAEARR
jgi:hypothetical protein